jgi:hypothetical protein
MLLLFFYMELSFLFQPVFCSDSISLTLLPSPFPSLNINTPSSTMHSVLYWLRFFHILNPTIPSDAGFRTCKALPNTQSWPPDTVWSKLNDTISGNLLKPLPPGSVCDPALPDHNNATCATVYNSWSSSGFHANDPVSVDWPNQEYDACLPTDLIPCNTAQYPVYVINASEPQHVQAGVDFARYHNVRLIVKGTGHDFLGR